MLNVDRVRYMTQLAMFEKNELREFAGTQSYTRDDYVHTKLLLGLIAGSIFYAIAYAVGIALLLAFVVKRINSTFLILAVTIGLLVYLLFIYIYLRGVGQRARRRYDKGLEVMAHFQDQLEGLEEIYRREEE